MTDKHELENLMRSTMENLRDMIDVNTTIKDFFSHLIVNPNYSYSVDSLLVNDEWIIYTGGKTTFYKNSEIYAQYTNIVRGDVNGDAKVNYLDYVIVYNHIYKIPEVFYEPDPRKAAYNFPFHW